MALKNNSIHLLELVNWQSSAVHSCIFYSFLGVVVVQYEKNIQENIPFEKCLKHILS